MGGKKLAIDSSIWLYQFQIAMRDKEGRALDNAHILGFLRRICKLLFYGIKPVFVFDGGAPTIKKVAISNRKNRKQGAKESAARTAEKLLAAQLRAAAIKQARKNNAQNQGTNGSKVPPAAETDDLGNGTLKYMDDDYGITPRGAPQPRPRAPNTGTSSSPANVQGAPPASSDPEDLIPKKKKYVHKDQYALPIIEGPISARGAPSDPRLATEAELRSFIDDMRPEDFDMDSEFFGNLPVEAKYEIIGDLRIKSRQSNYKRVEAMKNAPTPLDFSRAQIMGLAHRNDLTQKLLTMTDSLSRVMPMSGPVRIAGERNKEYVLIKNDTSEGTGYILGVRGGGETASTPVKIEGTTTEESDMDKTSTDEEFEQVPIPSHDTTIVEKSSTPEVLERRREMAKEAIRQRYSPVKSTRRRGDSPVDDLPALPPQRPLFINERTISTSGKGKSQQMGKTSAAQAPHQTDIDVWNEITSAVASADGHTGRLSRDEEEDLQRAIEASKRDISNTMHGQADPSMAESGDESDVSFDEVETGNMTSQKQASLVNRPMGVQGQIAHAGEDSDDSVEFVRADTLGDINAQAQPSQRTMVQASAEPPRTQDQQTTAQVQNNYKISPGSLRTQPASFPCTPAPSDRTTAYPASRATNTGDITPLKVDVQEGRGLQRKKPQSLHLDIPPAAFRPISQEQEQHGRTPRPDLTEEQARRDTSPQLVAEHDGIVERDYAPQHPVSPKSAPAKPAPLPELDNEHLSIPETREKYTEKPGASPSLPRPSLMERTLSSQSGIAEEAYKAKTDSVLPKNSTVSQADLQAVSGGPISVLDEVKAAIPNVEGGVDKGDLQEEVQSGNVAGLADKVNGNIGSDAAGTQKYSSQSNTDERHEGASSPEIVYEWSASPEPASRELPADPTLLPPDDPNHIPADIDFPEPGHELSDLDDEDQEHLESLNSEQVEYAKFLAELKSRNLEDMEDEVENELIGLKEQDKRDKKMADDITVQMANDIQLLLKVLGLPYVIAPMEAEAQCAELLSRSLVDGVITDDNDVFLFGATKVYKNMFNQNKYVECYLATDIERELALDRHRLIRLAHFLGSDYCDGLPGVGPVLGMELMAEFPGPNGLYEFRDWWLKVQRGRDTPADHPTAFRRKFKKSKKELYIDEGWPNPEVTRAYLQPSVDQSDQPFMWGIPDLDALRDYLRSNLGWGQTKTDELMLPIIRKMTGRAAGGAVNQSVISNFFDVSGGTGRYAPMSNKGYQSKRLQAVVKAWRQSQQRLAKEEGSEDDAEELAESGDDVSSNAKGKKRGGSVRSAPSRKNSGTRGSSSRPSSSRRSSKKGSSQAGEESSDQHDSEEENRAFNEELEAKLAKMGVKRKRETPVGSTRVVKPAKRSKRGGGKLAARARQNSVSSRKPKSKTPLFAQDSGSEEDKDETTEQDSQTSAGQAVQSQSQPRTTASKTARKAVLADSDEYEE